MMKFPDNARLGLTLYFTSPSLGKIMFVEVDASPVDDGELGLLPEGIAVLTTRWCAALNRSRQSVTSVRRRERKSSPVYGDMTAADRPDAPPPNRPARHVRRRLASRRGRTCV
jgi:hypothetical protein